MRWQVDNADISKSASGFLDRSGCYIATIKEFNFEKTKNGADQAKIKLEVEGNETTIYHVYSKTTGEQIPWKARHINHLAYLNKLKTFTGVEFIGVQIGVFLKAKLSQDKRFVNFDIEGFFHPEHRKTANEFKNGLDAKEVNKMEERYSKEQPIQTEYVPRSEDDIQPHARQYQEDNGNNNNGNFNEDDEFPF